MGHFMDVDSSDAGDRSMDGDTNSDAAPEHVQGTPMKLPVLLMIQGSVQKLWRVLIRGSAAAPHWSAERGWQE